MKKYLPLLLVLIGCHAPCENVAWTTFTGRAPFAIYRAKVPPEWKCERGDSFADTTQPNCTFFIEDAIRLTIHTFPTDSIEERVPPGTQVERWRRQMTPFHEVVQGVTWGGFAGLFFEGIGAKETVLAWSLSLDPDHYLTLQFLEGTPEERAFYKQMRADFTIKAKGPTELIEKHRASLMNFARSFQLIEEIPRRS